MRHGRTIEGRPSQGKDVALILISLRANSWCDARSRRSGYLRVLPDRARGRRAGCGCAARPARADLSSDLYAPSLLTRPPSWRVARRCVGRHGHDSAAAPSREAGPAPSSATQPTATRVRTLIGEPKPQSGSGLSRTCLVACAVSPVTYARRYRANQSGNWKRAL